MSTSSRAWAIAGASSGQAPYEELLLPSILASSTLAREIPGPELEGALPHKSIIMSTQTAPTG